MRSLVFLFSLIFCLHFSGRAQNLVPNESFEIFSSCPTSNSQLIICPPWDDPPFSGTTCDYFNACVIPSGICNNDVGVPNNFAGSSNARTGNAYAGVICKYTTPNLREYLQVELSSPLQAGRNYIVEVWVKLASSSRYAISNFGIYVSNGAVNQPGNQNIPETPQIESNSPLNNSQDWTLITGIYLATGGEDFITIGSFRTDANSSFFDLGLSGSTCILPNTSAYYFVDDVRVEMVQEVVEILGDTLMCVGSNLTLEANANVNFFWSSNSAGSDTLSLDTFFLISPSSTTTYFLHGIQVIDSISITVLPVPVPNLGQDDTICANTSILLDAGHPGASYFWSTGQRTQTISVSSGGIFWVRVDNGACAGWDSITVTLKPNPLVELGATRVFCPYLQGSVELTANTGAYWLWQPGLDTNRTFHATKSGKYSVTVLQSNGCTSSDSVLVTELCPVSLYLPSGFTPNGDGYNDYFVPVGMQVESYKLFVFDRWGQLVFESNDQDRGWDGKTQGDFASIGVYVWVCEYKGPDEKGISKTHTIRGRVNLIR